MNGASRGNDGGFREDDGGMMTQMLNQEQKERFHPHHPSRTNGKWDGRR